MLKAVSLVMTVLFVSCFLPQAIAGEDIAGRIAAMPAHARVEVQLTNKRKLQGATGTASLTGFTLVDMHATAQWIAFADVASVKCLDRQLSHRARNVLIAVGAGAVALAMSSILRSDSLRYPDIAHP